MPVLFRTLYACGLFSLARLLPWWFIFSRLCSSEAVKLKIIGRDRCGATTWLGVSSACLVVELGHEFPVGGAGGGEVVVAFFELQPQVGDLLFQAGDLLAEGVDVGGCAESGLAPGLVAECLGQPFFQVLDAGAEPDGALVRGEQVCLQRGSGHCRAGAVAGDRFGLEGVDLLQQVAVPVKEGAVDSGCASDPGPTDLGAVGGGAVECGDDALAAAGGIGIAAVEHRLSAHVRRDGFGCVPGFCGGVRSWWLIDDTPRACSSLGVSGVMIWLCLLYTSDAA